MELNIWRTACAALVSSSAPTGFAPVAGVMRAFPPPALSMNLAAASSSAGVTSSTTPASPMPTGSTKRRTPPTFFLSAPVAATSLAARSLSGGKRTIEIDQALHPLRLAAGDRPALPREIKRGHHAPAHRFAVEQHFVARRLLDGVADRMAEIQNHAQARFALVPVHHVGLHADRSGDHLLQRLRVAAQHFVDMLLHESAPARGRE